MTHCVRRYARARLSIDGFIEKEKKSSSVKAGYICTHIVTNIVSSDIYAFFFSSQTKTVLY